MPLVKSESVEVESASNDPHRRVSTSESQFATKMYLYGREICFLLAILFTSYAALQNGTPKVSKSPSAVPFFSRTSLVTDFYQGQLSSAFERVSESDISFVMYYAPWDAESQALRSHFKAVAQYYYRQVYFVAINCWQPLSECRQQFSKIQTYPVLIAYTQHTKGIQYKGIKEAGHMIRFLHHLLNPVQRVHTTSDLVSMMSQYDAVVIGFFNFLGNIGGPGYHTFYSTTLKFLERDPHREIGFAVVTDEATALRWEVYQTPAVRIYMWNETLEYSQIEEYTPEALSKWVSDTTHQVSVWVSPPGVKSLTLAPYIEESSVLILFTPRNPLHSDNYNYELLRVVGLEYYNCDKNPWVNDLTNWLAALRQAKPGQYKASENECTTDTTNELRVEHLVATVSLVGANISCDRRKKLYSHLPTLDASDCTHEKEEEEDSLPHNYYVVDPRSSASLVEAEQSERCRKFRRAGQLHRSFFPRKVDEVEPSTEMRGLACRTNKTLSLIAIDSLQYAHFATGLGVDVATRVDKTTAIILSAHDESSYTLEGELNKASLTRFITDYTEGRLRRTLRSSQNKSLQSYPVMSKSDCYQSHAAACVQELSTNTFQSVVMNTSQSVVLFYHSPHCAFCSGLSHVFLIASRYFRTVNNLTFARIDGENNDLPWEYTMHHYPTILYFPARRKSDSRVYPHNLPITVPNLVNFVLANLGPGYSRLQGLIGLCSSWSQTQDLHESRHCLAHVRRECLQAISNTLTEYRSAVFRWQVAQSSTITQRSLLHYQTILQKHSKHLLFKLQHLKQVHLLLESSDRLEEVSREFVAIQQSFHLYQNTLRDEGVEFTPNIYDTFSHTKEEL